MRLDEDPEAQTVPMSEAEQARFVVEFAKAWVRCERGPGMIDRVIRKVFPAPKGAPKGAPFEPLIMGAWQYGGGRETM
jgi:hypothetical protein